MQVFKISRKESGLFSDHQLRVINDQSSLEPYIYKPFTKESIADQIKLKSSQYSSKQREILVDSLEDQYGSSIIPAVRENIDALIESSTYTVTTGHQLTLLAGPLFFVVKILHVIKLTQELNDLHPDNHFVPIYWMASEDHDFEEIQDTSIFNKKVSHNYKQQGPVGQFDLVGFDQFKADIIAFFGEDKQKEIATILNAYSGENLADATRGLVNELFSEYGLVIIDGNSHKLKSCFADIMKDELFTRVSENLVNETGNRLKNDGFKVQVTPRPINLFYIEKGVRNRIEFIDDEYHAGEKSWSEEGILDLLKKSPESFSPNVVLRPLYQELTLPNLAYIGGVGEISYWLQLKSTFENYEIQYPIIQVRNSLVWIDKSVAKKLTKIGITWNDVFTDRDQLKKKYVEKHSSSSLSFGHLDELKSQLNAEILNRTLEANPNLAQYASAETARLDKQLEGIKNKLVKDAKGKHEQAMKNIDFVKDRILPNGRLQERSTNFLSFCADGIVKDRLNQLYSAIDPFSNDLIVLFENESS